MFNPDVVDIITWRCMLNELACCLFEKISESKRE